MTCYSGQENDVRGEEGGDKDQIGGQNCENAVFLGVNNDQIKS